MAPPFDRLGDQAARELAQTEFDHPVAVEAGAGTGKTTVLVARILAWSLGAGWQRTRDLLTDDRTSDPTADAIATRLLEGLVAITFTEAAAAQMERRVATALTMLAADPTAEIVGFHPELLPTQEPQELTRRARALVGSLDRLAIRTIHSHCWHLLSAYSMAAGLSPELLVDADGHRLEEVVREVVEAQVKQALRVGSQEPLRRLTLLGIDPRSLAAAVTRWVSEGGQAAMLKSDPLSPQRRAMIRRRLLDAATALGTLTSPLLDQNRAPKDRQTAAAVDQMRSLLAAEAAEPDLESLSHILHGLRQTWPDDRLERLSQWAKGDFTRAVEQAVAGDLPALSPLADDLARSLRLYRRLDASVLDVGRRALRPLIARVEDELRSRGIVTFASLMSETWRLLRDHPQVLSSERRRLDQLLVDEFQDTDRLQCDLVRFLSLGGEKDERPGLFVVGDPKQSIYGWRDADLEAYEDFLEDLRAGGGFCVALDRNFRSVPPVLREVDRSLEPLMKPEPGLQPAFASLVACDRLATAEGFQQLERTAVEYWVSWAEGGPRTRAEEAARLEAAAIARDIRQLHEEAAVPWSDFGLLLRSTSKLETYLGALRAAQVPFVVTSDKHYFRRREIIEAAALLRTIIVPVDHLALTTFLRSSTVGVPDAALLPLWRQRFPELVTALSDPEQTELAELRALVERVAGSLPSGIPGLEAVADWSQSLVAALENLAHLRRDFRTEPADRFIRRLRRRFLFDVTESARHLGLYRLANLDRFFRQLAEAMEEQEGDTQAVLRSLRRSVAESAESEQALPEGATEAAVQVMTIHGAKGLEFGHVYLPQLHAKGRRNQRPSVEVDRRWSPGREPEYVLFGSPTPGYDRIEKRQQEIERTEQIRTLYVALTRARERLVLLGKWPAAPTPLPVERRVTYLDLLRSRPDLPESLTEVAEECATSPASYRDQGAARWRFPGLTPSPSVSRKPGPGKSGLPTLKEVRRQTVRLDRLRTLAAARMERPLAGAASDEASQRLERLAVDELDFDNLTTRRDIVLSVGSAFHRLMETWRWGEDPQSEMVRQRQIQSRWLAAELPGHQLAAGMARFEELLDRFHRGRFFQRFVEMDPETAAREVPILLPPADDEVGPVGFVTGFIDLLYLDPRTDRWTIVDYKTDRIEEPEIAGRASAYAQQEAIYARALTASLDLESQPAMELWFIWPDLLWEATDPT